MSRILLREWVETETSLEPGGEVGILEVSDDGVTLDVPDAWRARQIQSIIEEGVVARFGDPSGISMTTVQQPVQPGHEKYVSALLERLEKKDVRLIGEILAD
jgi:hypothetical protein